MSDVSVIFGGPSPEHEISILTGLQCERILTRNGSVGINPVYVDRSGVWHLVPPSTEARDYLNGAPNGSRELTVQVSPTPGIFVKKGLRGLQQVPTDAVINAMHGGLGEGGGFAALMELINIPATGGTSWASSLCIDKHAFGSAIKSAGIPTLPRELLTLDSEHSISGPLIVKPRFGGSSIGIEVADDIGTARALLKSSAHLRQGAVVEPYRADLSDYNIAFRTSPTFEVSEIERPLRNEIDSIYSYQEKYLNESGLQGAPREMPAKISEETRTEMHALARRVAEVTGITGIVRLDFLSNDDGEVYVNEANTIPGAMSLYLWTAVPVDRLLLDAVDEVRRNPPRSSAATGHGQNSALQAAGGIAGKLTGLDIERR